MFQRDYILRLIEQFAKTLGTVLTLKKSARFDEAELTIAQAAKELGLDVDTLLALPVEQVATLLSQGGIPDAGKCLVAAEILHEHADIRALRNDEETAYLARIRALVLLLDVSGREGLERVPNAEHYRARIRDLMDALSPYRPVPAVQRRLVFHHEREGTFADAEDLLFELVDAGHDDLIAPGIELYERLLAKSDEALVAGGLPRDEVLDGLGQLRDKSPSVP